MKSTKFFSLVLIFSLLAVISAGATPWTAAGSTGTVDESDLDLFRVQLNNICHKTDKTGTIVVYYNVTNPFDFTPVHTNWNYLGVTFKDTAPGSPAFVYACLRRVNFITGVDQPVVCFNSNNYALEFGHEKVFFPHVFDFEKYAYYIMAYIVRSTTDEKAVLYALKLGFDWGLE